MLTLRQKNTIHPQLLLFAAWIVMVFFDERLMNKFFLSNIIAISLCFFALTTLILKKANDSRLLLLATGFILLASGIAYLQFGAQTHFIEELGKSILVLSGGVALSKLYSTEAFEFFLKPFPIILAAYLFIQFFIIGAPDSYHRLALDRSLGSANTLGYLMCFATIILLYSYRGPTLLKWMLIVFYCVLIAKTYSRSATVGLIGGILLTFLFRRKNPMSKEDWLSLLVPILIIGTLFILEKFGPQLYLLDPPTLIPQAHDYYAGGIHRFHPGHARSAGRIEMWTDILKIIAHQPTAWLTGFGPGLVPQLNLFNRHYLSIDSILVKFFYSFGVIGLMIASVFCFKLINTHSDTHRYNILKGVLGIFMVFTLVTNDTTSAAQAILYGMLLVGFVLSNEKCKTHLP